MNTHPKWDQQVELEERMTGLGQDRFWKRIERARATKHETSTDYGHRLVIEAITPLSAAIREWTAGALVGNPGRHPRAVNQLKEVHPDVAAYLTVKTVLDAAAVKLWLTFVAIQIGRTIEDEARFRHYRGENPAYYDTIMRNQRERKKRASHIRKVMILKMGRSGVKWPAWTVAEKLQVGMQCLDLMQSNTGYITIEDDWSTARKGRAPKKRIVLTAETQKWIENRNAMTELLTPAYLPMVIPPKPWSTPFNGGYWTDAVRHVRMVKTTNMNYLEDLRHTEMPVVYEAINAIQSTAWTINCRVLDVLAEVWDSGLEIGHLPAREDFPVPTKPADIATNEEARIDWSRRKTSVLEKNEKLRSKRVQVAKTLWVAGMFKDEEAIYFPHQLDFRGRVYAVSMFLNPQACDYSKALLTFAEGKAIETPEAAQWLAIHGANAFGFDKASLVERVQWVAEHEAEIAAVANDPLGNRWWCDADKPWQFLAWCFEWAAFTQHGAGYLSSLPVALDGTCNGLQHFSAMLRDEVGGKAVNLVPSDQPQDIYQRVADKVIENLHRVVGNFGPDGDATEAELADKWLKYGVTRKTTKRPVMILPYGGTLYACRKYSKLHLEERVAGGEPSPFGEEKKEQGVGVDFIASNIWSSIGDVVIAAKAAMGWLQDVARAMSEAKLPINWTTPAGFPARQAYPDMIERQVKTTLHGTVYRARLLEESEELDLKRQVTGLSPNFVHSMDGAALMLSVCRTLRQGVTSFAMVHDSYGTHAADTAVMASELRDAFVEMYQDQDVLRTMLQEPLSILVPAVGNIPLPRMGALDIGRVRESDFFFA